LHRQEGHGRTVINPIEVPVPRYAGVEARVERPISVEPAQISAALPIERRKSATHENLTVWLQCQTRNLTWPGNKPWTHHRIEAGVQCPIGIEAAKAIAALAAQRFESAPYQNLAVGVHYNRVHV
jgi:hypothetical protein